MTDHERANTTAGATPSHSSESCAVTIPASRPVTIAFVNQKGGVGKTTTVVNLAAAVARRSVRVLIVDLDPQAHATLHLGHDPDALERSIYDALLEPSNASSALIQSRERLLLLPSEVDLAAIETELADEPDRQRRLRLALDRLADRADAVFIDCPPSLGLLTLNALAAADLVVAPMQAHFLALQGVGKLIETVHLMARRVNPTLRVAGVVLCMHDEQTTHGKEVVADLESFFHDASSVEAPWAGGKVFRPAIRRNIKLAESPSFGQTIFEYAPSAPGARDYDQLAAVIIDELLTQKRSAEHDPKAADVQIVARSGSAEPAQAGATEPAQG